MQKKFTTKLLAFLLFTFMTTTAHASFFDIFKTTGAPGDTTEKTIFALNETPWLYVRYPFLGVHVTEYGWKEVTDSTFSTNQVPPNDLMEDWYPLTNWEGVKKPGLWEVSGIFVYPPIDSFPGDVGTPANTFFTVTPEPVSTLLFLTGGAVLAVRSSRRKKQTA